MISHNYYFSTILLVNKKLVHIFKTKTTAWHSVSLQDISGLEKIDEALLRYLLDCHPKTPLEFLFLESGAIPMRYILSSRRINYLQTILKRDEEELTRRVFEAQLVKPCSGDFAELVKKDLESIGMPFNKAFIQNTGVDAFKAFIKKKITAAAHMHLTAKQADHSKVSEIKFESLETQPYLLSTMFSDEETKLLTALRSRMHDGFKKNFSQLHGGQVDCPLECWSTNSQPFKDSQQHLLVCKTILDRFQTNDIVEDFQYSDLFGKDIKKQKQIAVLFAKLIEIKQEIKKEREPANLDPCISYSINLCNGDARSSPVLIVCPSGNK